MNTINNNNNINNNNSKVIHVRPALSPDGPFVARMVPFV
jgi:hypothetical protein